MIWQTAHRQLDLGRRAVVMGVLNVTPDSFSDGGKFFDPTHAAERGRAMLAEGADLLDIGGESTRPGAVPVAVEEELARVLPVIERLRAQAPQALLSIDTSKAAVAAAALAAGASIVNDVTALRGDPAMAALVRARGAGVVLMHMQGEPATMQRAPSYPADDVVTAVRRFFQERLAFALASGIAPEQLAFDPGLGFGKTAAHNLALCRALPVLGASVPSRPLVLGASRKRFLAVAAGLDPAGAPAERDGATLALSIFAREKGVRVLRVHAVRPNVEALRAVEALLHGQAGSAPGRS
ncbi:MAG: dihydropteroate synthase [Verrucomicrobia bacterium]|nr:dihydropteroate synthase [Verrucomicrobiota bacterium]MBV9656927.1 dihydropteroate synthase [Verrucomicrobiota bacterium]